MSSSDHLRSIEGWCEQSRRRTHTVHVEANMIIFSLVLTALCIMISLINNGRELSQLKIVDTFLLYILVINVGLSGLMAFYRHSFMKRERLTSEVNSGII